MRPEPLNQKVDLLYFAVTFSIAKPKGTYTSAPIDRPWIAIGVDLAGKLNNCFFQ